MGSDRYVIRGGVEGRERLRLLSEVMGPNTRALMDRIGVTPGAICLDVGCGGGDVTLELARRVGPAGKVVGIDLDSATIEIARREAAQQGMRNVIFEVGEVGSWEPDRPFDLVYVRFLLTHLPDPPALLAALRRHVRTGGVIAVEDIDCRGHFYEPDCPAMNRFVELYTMAVERRGADPSIGPKLPGLLRGAGFEDVKMNLFHPAALEGGMKLLTCVTMENVADVIVADGLASREEVQQTIEDLYAFARDPHTVHGGPRVFQAWGRR
jgi:SAM-dependent methyltransferase